MKLLQAKKIYTERFGCLYKAEGKEAGCSEDGQKARRVMELGRSYTPYDPPSDTHISTLENGDCCDG